MKIVFFSDIHGNKYAFDAFLCKIKDEVPDKIIFCGDVFGYYYYADEIIFKLRKEQVTCILGNHDKMFIQVLDGMIDKKMLINKYGSIYQLCHEVSPENVDFIRSLNSKLEFKIDGMNFGVFHGSPSEPLHGRIYPDSIITDYESYEKYDYVILGHTHHKLVRKINKTMIINPGSLGQQRDGKGCSYIVFDTRTREYHFKTIEYDVNMLLKDIDKFDDGNEHLKEMLLRKR